MKLQKLLDDGCPFILAHWHGEEYGIYSLVRRYHAACIISTSKDGELINKVIHLMGGATVRGSSTRGGVQALKGIIRLGKQGWRPSFAVDGPKGPLHEVKPGVIHVAKMMKAPIVPINMASSNPHFFEKSWNRAELPKPFSRVHIVLGEPIYVSKNDDLDEGREKVALALSRGRQQALSSVNNN